MPHNTLIVEATKALKSQTRKKIPAEPFLLIWYPRGPTYDQKNPRHPTATNIFLFCSYLKIYERNLRKWQKSGFFDTLTMIFPKLFILEICNLSYFNSFNVF